MKILLTNDDGLYSAGLKAAYDALSELGEVFVVAPAVQRSGVGRSLSIMEPIRVSEVKVNGMRVFAVDGTPTDSVIIGMYEVIGEIPDLAVSGINLGENLSTEAATTSGTVGAALEAATHGSKTIAISLQMPDVSKFELTSKADFSFASKVLRGIAEIVLYKGLPEGVDLLNVNVPAKPNGKIAVTRLARRMYRVSVEKRLDPRGREYYWIHGEETEDAEEGTDIHALRQGYVSITPLKIDLTASVEFDIVEGWFDGLEWEV
ncbi:MULTISPECIES: 5'/3'-nucleotidase SurE [Archaeoglobus]|jgi:5'-nucleotidase|uniref:5'-nucleotidase SurE n=1 Tax=Archaeoglobus fulgidus TaxID=2234 RepID=A0A124F7U3_ARCFL|nr:MULTISPECIES: 5'/3'-nucleotidase SurE [Archaeoglobus]KUJ92639.1 MAG: 5'-nucleotidase SurE [Archaeoglobus fulgidus]MDI3498242.1 5/3-nucleotidase [Archaeoglobus sp.]